MQHLQTGLRVILLSLFAIAAVCAQEIIFPDRVTTHGAPHSSVNGQQNSGFLNQNEIRFIDTEKENLVECRTYENERGFCKILFQCATFFADIAELSRSPCTIDADSKGVCCVEKFGNGASRNPLHNFRPPPASAPNIPSNEINLACEEGIRRVTEKKNFEAILFKDNDNIIFPDTPADRHGMLFQTTDEVILKSEKAELNLEATKNMAIKFNLDAAQSSSTLPQFSVKDTPIADTCPTPEPCPPDFYRSMDGRCNNLQNPNWGKAAEAFQRILPSQYDNGIDSPRTQSVLGGDLPSGRELSQAVTVSSPIVYENYTLLLMQWGQFADHDITHTPLTRAKDRRGISCCSRGLPRPSESLHPACFPITIPPNDPFFSQHGQRCMEFVRSLPAIRPECNFGPREQMSQITAFMDASNVYGSSDSTSRALRAPPASAPGAPKGQLRTNVVQGSSLLPKNAGECVDRNQPEHACFKAGDSRVNEQPDLVVLHTIWLRQHNQIAAKLSELNPFWSDDTVYQEARRIVAAQMQHITYKEYLPHILGRTFMEGYDLIPRDRGFYDGYRPDINPTITNGFATAAFRYGHTLIPGKVQRHSRFGSVEENLILSKNHFAPFMLYRPGVLDSLIRGLSIQPSEQFDNSFTDELINHLFAGKSQFGMDLFALNIQRGRDHGLPSYNSWRKICELPRAETWEQFGDTMNPDAIEQLRRIYAHPDDVDFFVGGISERPTVGSLLGHTFLCVVGDQFTRLKRGDRFYYENGGMTTSFTEAQLDEIRKTSLSRVLCDNSDDLEYMQPKAFIKGHVQNVRALCRVGNLIPRMNLGPWKAQQV